MLRTDLKADLFSCFSPLVMLARRNDLVAIVRESNLYRVYHSSKFDLETIDELKLMDSVVIIVRGKMSKSKLTLEERKLLVDYIRDSNASLN